MGSATSSTAAGAAAPAEPTDLLGRWRLDRWIDVDRTGERWCVAGEAELARTTDGRVRWSEHGELRRRDGGSRVAPDPTPVRRLLWVEHRGDGWWVTFEDGRDFHPWVVDQQLRHPCGPDLYLGWITVSVFARVDPGWTVTWRCRGPDKDYRMHTRHTRR